EHLARVVLHHAGAGPHGAHRGGCRGHRMQPCVRNDAAGARAALVNGDDDACSGAVHARMVAQSPTRAAVELPAQSATFREASMAIATARSAFINGEWIAGDGEEIEVRSPYDGSLVGSVHAATPSDVNRAVAAARDAFPAWRKTPLRRRVELCRRAYDL